jgi:hypothetical protein
MDMSEIAVEQALYHRPDGAAPELLARSAGFSDDWLPEVEKLLRGFGERPPGMACPAAVFARPLGPKHVAVVQAADHLSGSGQPVLAFHLLVLPRDAYDRFLGDPFAVADRCPPPWQQRGELPALTLPAEPLPPRTVAEIQQVLQRTKTPLKEDEEPKEAAEDEEDAVNRSEGPALLGGVQVLVDGGKVVFERPAPDTGLVRSLWALLPTSTRNHLWPASFAFDNALGFDVLVVPRVEGEAYAGYTNEDQAADYPPGYYELNLQIAAEAGDQHALDALFGRRSLAQTWHLGLILLVFFSVLAFLAHFLDISGDRAREVERRLAERRARTAVAVGLVGAGDTWNTLITLPAARQAWNAIGKEAP